jgi:hypothetical protein
MNIDRALSILLAILLCGYAVLLLASFVAPPPASVPFQ